MSAPKLGRPAKGDRAPATGRFPKNHLDLYKAQAAAAGLPLGDYLALVMARAHGLDEPGYLTTNRNQPLLTG